MNSSSSKNRQENKLPDISSAKETNLESEVHFKIKESRATKFLALSNTNLSHLHKDVFQNVSHSLKHLYLSNCNFSGKLPPAIFSFKLLQTLDISRNVLEAAPDDIFKQLYNLVTLDCSINKLISIPKCCNQLQKLKELNIANNKIIDLPHELGDLPQLQVLNLSNNLLRELPGVIFAGPISISLVHLKLEQNLLSTLPPEIGNLSALEELDIRNNCFRYLPASTRSLKKLTAFHHSGNDWLMCPPHVAGVPAQMQSSYGISALEKLYTYIHPP